MGHRSGPDRRALALAALITILLLAFAPRVLAFANGQAAVLVLGESSLTAFNPQHTSAGLATPYGLAFDSSGNLWVSDQADNRILEYKAPFSDGESASVVIGQANFTGSGAATSQTGLNAPEGLAFDHSGNLWVVDTSNNRILEYAAPYSNGEAASIVIGQPNFTSNGANTTATTLNQPQGIAFDSSGNMWVGDSLNSRVLEFRAPFSTGEAASLVIGEPDFDTADDQASQSGMSTPTGVAFDYSGNLWVADGIRVLEYTAPFSTDENASIVIGQNNFLNSSIGTSSTALDLPYLIAFDPGHNLWVSDWGNNRVLEYAAPLSTGEAASVVIGQPNMTDSAVNPVLQPTAMGLNHPDVIAFDSSGDLWVADSGGGRVLEFGGTASGASSTTHTVAASSTTSVSTTPVVTASSSTPPSSSESTGTPGGGIPEFPLQLVGVAALTAAVVIAYALLRERVPRSTFPERRD